MVNAAARSRSQVPGRIRQAAASGGTPASPRSAPGRRATLRRDARLRMGRGTRQRVRPRRPDAAVVDDDRRNGVRITARLRQSTTAPARATHSLTLYRASPAARSCSAPARSSGRGGSTARTIAAVPRHGHPACSRRPSTCSPTWACSRSRCSRARRRPRRRRTPRLRPRRSRSPPGRRRRRSGEGSPITRHRDRRGGGVVAGVEVSIDGGTNVAARDRNRRLDVRLDARPPPVRSRSQSAPSTTAATLARRARP